MKRVIHAMKIEEVSAVDRPAQEHALALIRKRDGAGTTAREQLDAKATELRKTETSLTREQAFAKVYEDQDNRSLVKAYKQERDAAIHDAEKPTLSKANIHDLAEALMVTDGMDMPGALRYLLHNKGGRALLRAAENHTAVGGRSNNGSTVRTELAARMDIRPPKPSLTAKIAKQIVEEGTTSLSEAEFTKLVKAQAQVDRLADETPEQAFSKYFSAGTEESRLVREAYRIARRTAA